MRETANDHSLKYIRARYGVPAYRGVEVKTHKNEFGVIEGGDGPYVKVSFEEKPKRRLYHPRDLVYLGVQVIRSSEP